METIYRDTIDPETIARHQSCADRFLKHAQTNIAEGNIERAIQAIARCLSHSATALAENRPLWHRSPRQMENVLRWYVRDGDFSRSHVKTFREIYNSPHLPKSKHHTTHATGQGQPTQPTSHANTHRRQNATHIDATQASSDGKTRRRQNTTHIDATQVNTHGNTNCRQNVTHIDATLATSHANTRRRQNSDATSHGNTHRHQNATHSDAAHANNDGQTNRRQNATHIDATKANNDGNTRRRQNTTHIDATKANNDGNTRRRQNVTHINDTQTQPTRQQTHHQRNAFTSLTRLRRRAAAFLKAANAIIAGQPLPVRPTQRYLRKPHEITPPTFYSVRDITNLPNFAKIRSHFRLPNELAAKTDPHGHYEFLRQEPVPCYCHPKPRKITTNSAFITLSPLWRRALEKTFHIKLPTPLPLRI